MIKGWESAHPPGRQIRTKKTRNAMAELVYTTLYTTVATVESWAAGIAALFGSPSNRSNHFFVSSCAEDKQTHSHVRALIEMLKKRGWDVVERKGEVKPKEEARLQRQIARTGMFVLFLSPKVPEDASVAQQLDIANHCEVPICFVSLPGFNTEVIKDWPAQISEQILIRFQLAPPVLFNRALYTDDGKWKGGKDDVNALRRLEKRYADRERLALSFDFATHPGREELDGSSESGASEASER